MVRNRRSKTDTTYFMDIPQPTKADEDKKFAVDKAVKKAVKKALDDAAKEAEKAKSEENA